MKSKIFLSIIIGCGLIFFATAINFISAATTDNSPEAIAIRVVANPMHYSPKVWYQYNIQTKGSPQSLTVDGYEAVRDGRTVYVNAAVIKYNPAYPDDNSKAILETNIYIISYNQDAENATIDIFGQILGYWKFNTNLKIAGTAEKNCNSATNKGCVYDNDCPIGDYCRSEKAKLIRDVKRLSDLTTVNAILKNYYTINNSFPGLTSGSYLTNKTISVWPSYQEVLADELGVTLPQDPINKLGRCFHNEISSTWTQEQDDAENKKYDPITCWNVSERKFATDLPTRLTSPITELKYLPADSHAYVYILDNAKKYTFCTNFETNYSNLPSIHNCSNDNSATIDDDEKKMQIRCGKMVGTEGRPYVGYFEVVGPYQVLWKNPLPTITPVSPTADWPSWATTNGWEWNSSTIGLTLGDTKISYQKQLTAKTTGKYLADGYKVHIEVTYLNQIKKPMQLSNDCLINICIPNCSGSGNTFRCSGSDGCGGTCENTCGKGASINLPFCLNNKCVQCDPREGNICCDANGSYAVGKECRGATGACDQAEVCVDESDKCPADTVKPAGGTCGTAMRKCEQDPMCDGASKTCPVNGKPKTAGSGICSITGSGDECDTSVCDGTDLDCPSSEGKQCDYKYEPTSTGACFVWKNIYTCQSEKCNRGTPARKEQIFPNAINQIWWQDSVTDPTDESGWMTATCDNNCGPNSAVFCINNGKGWKVMGCDMSGGCTQVSSSSCTNASHQCISATPVCRLPHSLIPDNPYAVCDGCKGNSECVGTKGCNTSTGECLDLDGNCISDANCVGGQTCLGTAPNKKCSYKCLDSNVAGAMPPSATNNCTVTGSNCTADVTISNLTADKQWSYNSTTSANTPCQWKCDIGFIYENGKCVPIANSCSDTLGEMPTPSSDYCGFSSYHCTAAINPTSRDQPWIYNTSSNPNVSCQWKCDSGYNKKPKVISGTTYYYCDANKCLGTLTGPGVSVAYDLPLIDGSVPYSYVGPVFITTPSPCQFICDTNKGVKVNSTSTGCECKTGYTLDSSGDFCVACNNDSDCASSGDVCEKGVCSNGGTQFASCELVPVEQDKTPCTNTLGKASMCRYGSCTPCWGKETTSNDVSYAPDTSSYSPNYLDINSEISRFKNVSPAAFSQKHYLCEFICSTSGERYNSLSNTCEPVTCGVGIDNIFKCNIGGASPTIVGPWPGEESRTICDGPSGPSGYTGIDTREWAYVEQTIYDFDNTPSAPKVKGQCGYCPQSGSMCNSGSGIIDGSYCVAWNCW